MQATKTPVLEAVNISKSYGEKQVLADVSFSAEEGEFVCIVGPSGTGKTTLLRTLSALGTANSGRSGSTERQLRVPQPRCQLSSRTTAAR